MRFLFDAHHLGLRQTGNETWCRNVVRHLDHLLPEHHVEYAITLTGKSLLRELTDSPYHIVSRSSMRRLGLDLPRIVHRVRPDAILTQYTMVPVRTSSLVMIHDLSPIDGTAVNWLPLRSRLRFRLTVAPSIRFSRGLLVPSEFTRRELVVRYGVDPSTVTVVPNAVDPDLARLFQPSQQEKPDDFIVLSVGNVLPRKNLLTVGHAVRRLLDAGMRIRYRIVGQVPAEGRATARELQRVLPTVEITGFVTLAELAAEYSSASVLAHPSLFEGYGIPIIEAMTAGLPVICSNATALPEVAGDAAIIVSPTATTDWERAIVELAGNEDLVRTLRARGYERANSFDWQATARSVAVALTAAGAEAPSRHSA